MAIENSDMKQTCKDNGDFNIVDGILVEYLGNDSSVVIPDGVIKIDDRVFLNRYTVKSVSIPVTVKKINEYAFNTLTDIHYAGTREQWNNVRKSIVWRKRMPADVVHCIDGDVKLPQFYIRDNMLKFYYGTDDSVVIPEDVNIIGNAAFEDSKSLVSITIADGVTEIWERAFMFCKVLKSIVIPDSVMKIGESAFQNCNSLKSIVIPDSVTEIGESAFQDCESLEFIIIPPHVQKINKFLFLGCDSLKSVSIPSGVKRICSGAFSDCPALAEIHFGGTKKQWNLVKKDYNWRDFILASSIKCTDGSVDISHFEINGSVLERYYGVSDSVVIPNNVIEIGNGAFCGCEKLLSVSIPGNVIEIGDGAFRDCWSLKSICIPDGIMEIHSFTFSQCAWLKSVSIPKTVRIIEDHAFSGCVSLSSIVIPDGVIKIYYDAFSCCRSLVTITIPASVTEIGEKAFRGCHSLKEIHYGGTEEQWNALVKGYGWNEGCTDLKVIFD